MLSLLRITGRRIGLRHSSGPQNDLRFVARCLARPKGQRKAQAFSSSVARRKDEIATSDPTIWQHGPSSTGQQTPQSIRDLPSFCPGCGAPSQTVAAESAGFYSLKRKSTALNSRSSGRKSEDDVFKAAMTRIQGGGLGESGTDDVLTVSPQYDYKEQRATTQNQQALSCDRCHQLRHHSKGEGIIHPSMDSIRDIIEESPHKENHIYHVIDAADFPLSLIPNLTNALELPRLRTQNRRSKSIRYLRGRVAEVSFIITRSDLLAPKKEQVDRLMPYLQEVLRDALGRTGKKTRLGNVKCVSAKRGWWTPKVKEDVWSRGGAGWMVGKVNVGKSALFEVIFPKGRKEQGMCEVEKYRLEVANREQQAGHFMKETTESSLKAAPVQEQSGLDQLINASNNLNEKNTAMRFQHANSHDPVKESFQETELQLNPSYSELTDDDENTSDDLSLLPPPQPETQYPAMPLVSSLPGTTASPIRIPFGGGKGELIDLPGISRSSLSSHVLPDYQKELIMHHRPRPEQLVIKSGQSLILAGMIRVALKTPAQTSTEDSSNENRVLIANPFLPGSISAHVTSTDKAIGIQTGCLSDGTEYTGTVPSILTPMAKSLIRSAGTFTLSHDVTKPRTGALTDPTAGKMKPKNLPFIVYGLDILIEGVGWVELTCQIRRPRNEGWAGDLEKQLEASLPEIEVWSPNGQYVGSRRPMNAWVINGTRRGEGKGRHGARRRPRMTIAFKERTKRGAG